METVPSSDQAIVDPLKIDGYLLSAAHPIGSAKARFFSRFGFSEDNPKELVDALLGHIRENAVVETQTSPFGVKYRVDGPLTSPDGAKPTRKHDLDRTHGAGCSPFHYSLSVLN